MSANADEVEEVRGLLKRMDAAFAGGDADGFGVQPRRSCRTTVAPHASSSDASSHSLGTLEPTAGGSRCS
jgi:hypothetical protein